MNRNEILHKAKTEKRDCFCTMKEDIEKELVYYSPENFKGKVVYCNCDTTDSNFYKYFVEHFEDLGLKELIVSGVSEDWKRYVGIDDGTYAIKYFGRNKEIERLRSSA